MNRHGHSKADRRSLHLHDVALEKLRRRPELAAAALALVERWLADPRTRPSHEWLEEWRTMLSEWTIDRIAERVLDEAGGQTLRQCSPLAPVLEPKERWRALREVNDAMRSETAPEP